MQTRFHTQSSPLPDEPEYLTRPFIPDSQIGHYGRLHIPGKPFGVETFLEDGPLSDETVDQINQGRLQLYVYGRILYESAGLKGVNQFCYQWHALTGSTFKGDRAGFRKGGPPEYNKHT